MTNKRLPVRFSFCLLGLAMAGLAHAQTTNFEFGGYIKLDAMYSDYSDGDLSANSGLRDFHIPGAIPVGGTSEDSDLDMHAKESRLNLRTSTDVGNGETIQTMFEMDFLLPVGGNERVSNSYDPRLRHAFLKWNRGDKGSWLAGQYWMTFMIIALPEDLDFIGTADGTTFGRNPQLRYTSGNGAWEFALENPETTVTPYQGASPGRIVADDNSIPDVVARYNHKFAGGSTLSAAAIVRQLAADIPGRDNIAIDDETNGWGLSLGGKVKVGDQDDLRWQVTTGSGLGRYIGLNLANGVVIGRENDLVAIDSTGGFIGYRHCWAAGCAWRSNINYSMLEVDNDTDLTGSRVSRSASSISANILYSPHPKLTFGAEYMHATRELENGSEGDLDRFQFSAKYAFGYKTKLK